MPIYRGPRATGTITAMRISSVNVTAACGRGLRPSLSVGVLEIRKAMANWNMPVMGDSTPRVKQALQDAHAVCPTYEHAFGYLISFAQELEEELTALREYARPVDIAAAEASRLPQAREE
jgi:hypothetical protein